MPRKTARSHRRHHEEDSAIRPTAMTLVAHIIRAFVVDGLFLLVATIAVAAYLYQTHLRNDTMIVLIFTGIALLALLRGCRAWQIDLDEYRRQLAMERHKDAQEQSTTIPGYYNSRRY